MSGKRFAFLTLVVFAAYIFQILMFGIFYMVCGGLSESLSFKKAIYFSTTTATTVGYGEIHPVSDQTRLVTSFQGVVSIVLFSSIWVILSLLATALERQRLITEQQKREADELRARTLLWASIAQPLAMNYIVRLYELGHRHNSSLSHIREWAKNSLEEEIKFSIFKYSSLAPANPGLGSARTRLSHFLDADEELRAFARQSFVEHSLKNDAGLWDDVVWLAQYNATGLFADVLREMPVDYPLGVGEDWDISWPIPYAALGVDSSKFLYLYASILDSFKRVARLLETVDEKYMPKTDPFQDTKLAQISTRITGGLTR